MDTLSDLFDNNRRWAARINAEQPEFFAALAAQQAPRYLWIGCSDSRVPANEIVDLPPGQLFVHRNVANLVVHTDLNCLSVLQYAIDVLEVGHVIVCGHLGCGGVRAAYQRASLGLVDNWLRHVQDVRDRHDAVIEPLASDEARINRLCELNVIDQVRNVCQTTLVQDAWARGQALAVHGWIYDVADGLLRDLGLTATTPREAAAGYQQALARAGAPEPRPARVAGAAGQLASPPPETTR